MQRYQWPGHEMRLLGELQRQQNSARFCDTLLQTEGISVPTHSCVLAALSPYLSQQLSASPSPPSGQKRQLQLQTVKAQTLLKLVSLLYSGVLEVKGNKERSDVLAAAYQFGITDFIQGQIDGGRQSLDSWTEKQESLKMQDAHVQAEMAGRRDENSLVRKECFSVGTQTPAAAENSPHSSVTLSDQTKPPNPETAFSSVAQSQDVCIAVPPQIIMLSPTSPSDVESPIGRSCSSILNPTSASGSSTETLTLPVSLNDSSSTEAREDCYQESSESGDSIIGLAKERTRLEDGNRNGTTAETERNARQAWRISRAEIIRKENSKDKNHSHGNTGVKDISKMKEMMETTQISIKVKLRRRTKGEAWEVVNMQSPDETLSVLTSLTQDCANHKMPQTALKEVQPPPSLLHPCPVQKPETQSLQTATTTNSSKQPEPNNTTSQSFSSSSFTANHNSEAESVLLPQSQGSVDESDEQIERLLEDIMIGLNILPNLEKDCKKSQPGHGGAMSICQMEVSEIDAGQGQMHTVASAAECVFDQNLGAPSGHTSMDTGIHCCSAALNHPSDTSFPTVQPNGLIQQQLQRCSPHCNSSLRSLGQSDGMSCQGSSKSQNSLYPEASTSSVMPSAFFSSRQKRHYPECQLPSSQDDQHIFEFFPLSTGKGAQSEHTSMDDLRLPQRLSPLEPSTSATKSQLPLNNPTNPEHDIQQQTSLHRLSWLSENPASLQFPFSNITCKDNESMPLPLDPNHSCQSKQGQEGKKSNPKNEGACAESCTMNSLKERDVKSGAELKSNSRTVKESFKSKQEDTTGGRRKKRRTNQQDTSSSFVTCKDSKASNGPRSCSVSLSSNNVLVNEREMAVRFSKIRCKLVEKSVTKITENGEEKLKEPCGTEQTQIRTRGSLKKSQEAVSNTTPGNSSLVKPVCRALLTNQQGASLLKKTRGRPKRIKLIEGSSENVSVIVEERSRNVDGEQQIDRDYPDKKEDQKTEKRSKKRRKNNGEEEEISLKKMVSAECTAKGEEAKTNDVRKPGTPNGRWVTLKEIKKLIKQQHSKKPKSKQNPETNKPVKDMESEVRANTDSLLVESAKENEMDIKDGADVKEHHEVSDVTVDKNHNPLFSTSAVQCNKSNQDDTKSSMSEKTSLGGDEGHPVSLDVTEDDVTTMSVKRKELLRSTDEEMLCGTGGSGAEEFPISDLDYTSHPQTLERTDPPLSDADGISRTSGCVEKGEEEDEEEVDILVYSPEEAPQTRVCEDGLLKNLDMTLDEEEEEDVNEIDVTGDEAE